MAEDIQELRRLVAQERRRATAKVARVRRNQGAILAGSTYDVRRTPGAEKKMNRRQLNSYVKQLRTFNSRRTQFAALAEGVPTTRKKANAFLERQERHNRVMDQRAAKIASARATERGQTYSDRWDKARAASRTGMGGGVFGHSNLQLSQIVGEAGLDKIDRRLRDRLNTRKRRDTANKGRRNLMSIVDEMGHDPFLKEALSDLTDSQVEALYSDRVFMDNLATYRYPAKNPNSRAGREIMEEQVGPIWEQINWVRLI